MRKFGIESLLSAQVSRAAPFGDEERAVWPIGPMSKEKELILDTRYETVH